MNFSILNTREMISNDDEELIYSYTETFSCEKIIEDGNKKNLNPEVERFLKVNAVNATKMKTVIAYLITDKEDGALLGYFALTHKPLVIPAENLSRNIRDKIKRFSRLNKQDNTYTVSAFLIAQLGKNYKIENGKRISGSQLLKMAKDTLVNPQNMIGGTIVYLDCEDNEQLKNFYTNENFTFFGERFGDLDGKKYLQYLAFI